VENIYKFIIHVVYNLFPLNEYSEGELRNLMQQFKDEADDLNITITDDKLKSYINRFDALKNSPKITEKDLRKYSLAQLIKLVTSSAGDEPAELDITPDVVYNNDDNTIVIYNGSKEGNCIRFGKGENWCITRGYYSNYRYSSDRGYPTFYLARNTNLPDNDKLSFVAIQVRDVPNDNIKYVYTNRMNSPNESKPMSYGSLLSEVPWLQDIPNLKNILRYIPLTSAEKETQKYRAKPIPFQEWTKFPFETKKQYLVVRKNDSQIFSDITNSVFVVKYLPKYPQIATFVCLNNGIIGNETMMQHLDLFSNQDAKSFIANFTGNVGFRRLNDDEFSFVAKKLLTKYKKWDTLPSSQRMYVTKDDKAIVMITLTKPIRIDVYTEDDSYTNIKLNKRTSRFLLDFPEIDTIPFTSLMDLVATEVIDRSTLDRILAKAKENPDSALIIKDTEDGQILVDSNTFSSYKIEDDKVTSIPIDSEEVQSILTDEEGNNGLQNNALKLLGKNIDSDLINKDIFFNIINSTPIDKRKTSNGNPVIIVNDEDNKKIIIPYLDDITALYTPVYDFNRFDWYNVRNSSLNRASIRAYFEYLRQTNQSYTTEQLFNMVTRSYSGNAKRDILSSNPPLADDNKYKVVVNGDLYYLLNKENPRSSLTISPNTGKLVKANISPRDAAQYLGQPAPAGEEPRRRGRRPAGAEAPQQAAAPAAAQDGANPRVTDQTVATALLNQYGLTNGFNSLPSGVRNRFLTGGVSQGNDDRGATRRNSALGRRGRVVSVISSGQSRFYIVRLASGTIIGSVATQPDAQHFIVTAESSFRIPNAGAFVDQLQARNLSENAKAIISLHAEAKPQDMKELKYLLKNKKKYETY
jgi:hypothetical protein